MSNLAAFKGQPIDRVPAGMADRLVWLSRFGKPRLGMYGSGHEWHATIEMHVADTVKGASFEVKSDFKHATPDEALGVLIDRMLSALAQLSGGGT